MDRIIIDHIITAGIGATDIAPGGIERSQCEWVGMTPRKLATQLL
jgi:hypothetical protein